MEGIAVWENSGNELPALALLRELLPDSLGVDTPCRQNFLVFRADIERIALAQQGKIAQSERRLPEGGTLTGAEIVEEMVDAAGSQRCGAGASEADRTW